MTPFILFTIGLALDNLIGNPRFLHKDRYCLWIRSEDTAAWRLTGTCQFPLCSQNAEAGVSLRFLNPKLMFLLSKLASSTSSVSSWRIMLMGADGAISQLYQTFNTWTQRRNEFYVDFEKQPPVHAHTHTRVLCAHWYLWNKSFMKQCLWFVLAMHLIFFSLPVQFSLLY